MGKCRRTTDIGTGHEDRKDFQVVPGGLIYVRDDDIKNYLVVQQESVAIRKAMMDAFDTWYEGITAEGVVCNRWDAWQACQYFCKWQAEQILNSGEK